MKRIAKNRIGSLSVLSEENETVSEHLDNKTPLLSDAIPSLRDTKLRWLALVLICISFGGTYYAGNVLLVLQTVVMNDLDINLEQFNTILSIGQFPGLILPFVSGLLIDRIGLRTVFVVGSAIDLTGYVVTALGVQYSEYAVIILGYALTTIGDTTIFLARNTMTVKWFTGKELSFSLGIGLGYGRLLNSASSFFSPMILASDNLFIPFWVGVAVTGVSFLATLGIVYIDKRTDVSEAELLIEQVKEKPKPITMKDFKSFRWIYIVLCLNIGLTYASVFGIINNANDMISKRFGFSTEESGRFLIIFYMCPVALTAVVGFIADKFGKRVLTVLIANVFLVGTQLTIAFLPDSTPEHKDYYIAACLVGLGVFYSVFAGTMWGCVALTVKESLTGLAFGIISCWSNLLAVIYPIVFGYIHDHTTYKAGYFWVQIGVTVLSFMTLTSIATLYVIDRRSGGRLNKPGSDRKVTVREKVYSHISIH